LDSYVGAVSAFCCQLHASIRRGDSNFRARKRVINGAAEPFSVTDLKNRLDGCGQVSGIGD
jgi:hypothetical protein